MGCADCSNLLPIFDSRSASSLPPTPQWEGIHWRVTDVLFLSRESSCLMLLKICSPPGDWRLCRMDRQSVKNTVFSGARLLSSQLTTGYGFCPDPSSIFTRRRRHNTSLQALHALLPESAAPVSCIQASYILLIRSTGKLYIPPELLSSAYFTWGVNFSFLAIT